MLKALAWKEFRELLPVMMLALLAQAFLSCLATRIHLGLLTDSFERFFFRQIPFIDDTLCVVMFLMGCLFAIAAGFWQTTREGHNGTFQFLFHRPVRRDAILATKMLVGVATCLLVTALPLCYYALWAATPGTHASPFFWRMTGWVWQLCLVTPVIYFAAFLSGIRTARWYGSRFLPVLAAVVSLLVIAAPLTLGIGLAVWLISIAIGLLICSAFILSIFHVSARRDYSGAGG
jgi:ABC-type transport system involved in multi-copper enzyme maturation permease subunit